MQMAAEGQEDMEASPSSVTHVPWLYESRPENEDRNVYPVPEESGKWMMFYAVSDVNQAWTRAKGLYRAGQLPDIKSMKVSTVMPDERLASSNECVVIFYCGPSSDKNKMVAIGRDLARKMDYRHYPRMHYKTDMQTIQGIRGSIYTIDLS